MATPTTTAPRAPKIHKRAQLELPTSRVRGMTRDPLNRVHYQLGRRATIALAAFAEHVGRRLLVDGRECARADKRTRVGLGDLRRAVDKTPGLYKPLLGESVAFGGAGVTVHFEANVKPMLRATAGTHTRRRVRVSAPTSAPETAEKEPEEEEEEEEQEVSSDEEEVAEKEAPPARKTRRRQGAKQLATAAAKAAKAKKQTQTKKNDKKRAAPARKTKQGATKKARKE